MSNALPVSPNPRPRLILGRAGVLAMLVASGAVMSAAWLLHLRFEATWSFATALVASWSMVLPEYALNTHATRAGKRLGLTGAQMAAVHLSSGVVFTALISLTVLGERLSGAQLGGLVLMLVAIHLIFDPDAAEAVPEGRVVPGRAAGEGLE